MRVSADLLARIFNFQKAYAVRHSPIVGGVIPHSITHQILDELIISGELQESSKKSVLRVVRSGF